MSEVFSTGYPSIDIENRLPHLHSNWEGEPALREYMINVIRLPPPPESVIMPIALSDALYQTQRLWHQLPDSGGGGREYT